MTEAKNNAEPTEVAPQEESTQSEQVATTEEVAQTPETVSENVEKTYAGKFNTVEDLETSYKELQSEFTKSRQAQQSPATEQAPVRTANQANPFDDETTIGVKNLLKAELENERANNFQRKNAKVLEDPMVSGTTQQIIQRANARGEYITQEDALSQAQEMLESRGIKATKEATAKGVAEGKDIAKKKEQAQAIGQTGKHAEVNPDDLSSDEFAKYHGLT